jgi:hypothetical protein
MHGLQRLDASSGWNERKDGRDHPAPVASPRVTTAEGRKEFGRNVNPSGGFSPFTMSDAAASGSGTANTGSGSAKKNNEWVVLGMGS